MIYDSPIIGQYTEYIFFPPNYANITINNTVKTVVLIENK